MGVGKSSVGRKLSKELSLTFYDSDHEIEECTGTTIDIIFEIESETGFRKRESHLLKELTVIPNIVLATGGGVILDQDNRVILSRRGFVVYLKSSIDHLIKKVLKDDKRPLLRVDDPLKTLTKLLEERAPLYEEIADLVINTDDLDVNGIVKQIVSVCK